MGKMNKVLIHHLRSRQEAMGVKAFHFKNVLGHHEEIQPAKYPKDIQPFIDAGSDAKASPSVVKLSTTAIHSEPKDISRTVNTDPISGPLDAQIPRGPLAKESHDPKNLFPLGYNPKGIVSENLIDPHPFSMEMPTFPVVCQSETQEHHIYSRDKPQEHLERMPRQNEFIDMTMKSTSMSYGDKWPDINENSKNPNFNPPLRPLQSTVSIPPIGAAEYLESLIQLLPSDQKAELGKRLGGSRSTYYPNNEGLQHIDPTLLPSGPMPFLHPVPIVPPDLQAVGFSPIRPVIPGLQNHSRAADSIFGGDFTQDLDNEDIDGRSEVILGPLPAKIKIAPPKGTPRQSSPVKGKSAKRKRNEDEDNSETTPVTPVRRVPPRTRRTPKKFT